MDHYNGFSYEEFYEFIIDFFEADTTPEGQEASAKLLGWWNKYVSGFIPTHATTNTEYLQSNVSEVCGHTRSRTEVSTTTIVRDSAATASGGSLV